VKYTDQISVMGMAISRRVYSGIDYTAAGKNHTPVAEKVAVATSQR
jgi:hypothetical protein